MINMDYCKFENTYKALKECNSAFGIAGSESEREYREKLIELCREIVNNYDDNDPEDD